MPNPKQYILGELRKNEFDKLLFNGKKEFYEKNAIIINEGEHTDCAYFINSGKVKIFLSDDQGKSVVLSTLTAGEFFGEMALIDKNERSATVMAIDDTELTVISQKRFRDLLLTNHDIFERILLCLVSSLRESNKKISSFVFKDAYERVANMLLSLAEDCDGLHIINEKPTQQHIANVVGVSREMVSRILKNMVSAGHISIAGKRIVIKQADLLGKR